MAYWLTRFTCRPVEMTGTREHYRKMHCCPCAHPWVLSWSFWSCICFWLQNKITHIPYGFSLLFDVYLPATLAPCLTADSTVAHICVLWHHSNYSNHAAALNMYLHTHTVNCLATFSHNRLFCHCGIPDFHLRAYPPLLNASLHS